MIDIITNNTWSSFVFSNYRRESDFISTDLIAFDIDDGMRIEEAEKKVEELGIAALCMPSTSHTEEQHKFRLIFPLSRTIRDSEVFKETYRQLAENFPVDPQCKDFCRFYFGSTDDDGFWTEGNLLDPIKPPEAPRKSLLRSECRDTIPVLEDVKDVVRVLYGEDREKIPEQVDYFIRNAHTGLDGLWHNSANSFVFTLSLQGVEFDIIEQVFEQLAPEPLDDHDTYLLERAFRDGQEKRSEEEKVDRKEKRRDTRKRRRRR